MCLDRARLSTHATEIVGFGVVVPRAVTVPEQLGVAFYVWAVAWVALGVFHTLLPTVVDVAIALGTTAVVLASTSDLATFVQCRGRAGPVGLRGRWVCALNCLLGLRRNFCRDAKVLIWA